MPIEDELLTHSAKRLRLNQNSAAATGPLGSPKYDLHTVAPQTILGLLQPASGNASDLPPGIVGTYSHHFYSNFYCSPTDNTAPDYHAADILEISRLSDNSVIGRFEVLFAADEAGQGDHYKVYLESSSLGKGFI